MKLFVGVTNNDWFRFLSERTPDEVNFWRPRSQMDFKALKPGDIFLFKLHSPLDFIAGGGVFVRHSFLPLPLAWQAFGEKNGVPDFETFERRILEHRDQTELIRQLGCTILVQPFFWPRELWIPVPSDWKKNIVTGKGYSVGSPAGIALWTEVRSRLDGNALPEVAAVAEEQERYGAPLTIQPRPGQGAFRVEVTDTYTRRCAITGEKTLPALEAGHIRPYAKSGPHESRNGLLLRSDLHNLFDLGYFTATLDYRVEVSRRIREKSRTAATMRRTVSHSVSYRVTKGSLAAPEFLTKFLGADVASAGAYDLLAALSHPVIRSPQLILIPIPHE